MTLKSKMEKSFKLLLISFESKQWSHPRYIILLFRIESLQNVSAFPGLFPFFFRLFFWSLKEFKILSDRSRPIFVSNFLLLDFYYLSLKKQAGFAKGCRELVHNARQLQGKCSSNVHLFR